MKAELEVQKPGEHIYAWLHVYIENDIELELDDIELNRVLSAREARLLNKQAKEEHEKYGWNFSSFIRYKPHGETCRFHSFDQVITEIPKFILRNKLPITEVYYKHEDDVVWKLRDESRDKESQRKRKK